MITFLYFYQKNCILYCHQIAFFLNLVCFDLVMEFEMSCRQISGEMFRNEKKKKKLLLVKFFKWEF